MVRSNGRVEGQSEHFEVLEKREHWETEWTSSLGKDFGSGFGDLKSMEIQNGFRLYKLKSEDLPNQILPNQSK